MREDERHAPGQRERPSDDPVLLDSTDRTREAAEGSTAVRGRDAAADPCADVESFAAGECETERPGRSRSGDGKRVGASDEGPSGVAEPVRGRREPCRLAGLTSTVDGRERDRDECAREYHGDRDAEDHSSPESRSRSDGAACSGSSTGSKSGTGCGRSARRVGSRDGGA